MEIFFNEAETWRWRHHASKGGNPSATRAAAAQKVLQLVPNLLAEITCPFKKGAGPFLTLWGHFSPPGESELCNIFKFNFLKEDSEFLLKVELIGLLDGTNKVERWDRESLDQFFTLFFTFILKLL